MTLALNSGIENRLIARPYLCSVCRLRSRLQGTASKLNRKLPNRDSNAKAITAMLVYLTKAVNYMIITFFWEGEEVNQYSGSAYALWAI